MLNDLKRKQKSLGIESEWVFCKADGSWTTTAAYYESLYKVSKKLGLNLSNNHAFRMALNSYVYIPMEIPATERAKLLGHSVETNLRHYTFSRSDDYNDELRKKINAFEKNQKNSNPERGTSGYLNIITFSGKEKSRNSV